jgi:hypothetical protein
MGQVDPIPDGAEDRVGLYDGGAEAIRSPWTT